jgi:hypothetical protein
VNKLKIEVLDEEDGSCTIHIEWDETDPDLATWTSWGEEGQRTFVLDALQNAIDNALSNHDS